MSRYGHIKLGRDEDDLEFSFGSWIAMLFSGVVGWHVRSYCEKNRAYRDVVLSRLRGEPDLLDASDYGPTYTEFCDGRITGGFTTGEPVRPGGPLVILYTDDLGEAQRRIEAAGAIISRQAFSFPGGRRFHFIDPDGYELAVWSADESKD
ncbi:BCCT family transporter [Pseudomonas sp. TCU-HL1]|uniref:BCCT family transporter n=1 Tax=Pseudomonas sp. TCU-HL1 TaxID=1856685 RepID=UPI000858C643|nr:Glyoxalase [Pseudomonas sp. TCU-HL1]